MKNFGLLLCCLLCLEVVSSASISTDSLFNYDDYYDQEYYQELDDKIAKNQSEVC